MKAYTIYSLRPSKRKGYVGYSALGEKIYFTERQIMMVCGGKIPDNKIIAPFYCTANTKQFTWHDPDGNPTDKFVEQLVALAVFRTASEVKDCLLQSKLFDNAIIEQNEEYARIVREEYHSHAREVLNLTRELKAANEEIVRLKRLCSSKQIL